MSTVGGRIQLSILAKEVLAAGISAGCISREFTEYLDLPNGTSDGQINKCYAARATGIGASVTTSYDLIGTLLDEDGTAINLFVKTQDATSWQFPLWIVVDANIANAATGAVSFDATCKSQGDFTPPSGSV